MKKLIRIVIGIVVIVIVIGGIYLLIPKSYITLSVAPSKTQLAIDGGDARDVSLGQTLFVSPGSHTYIFTRDGFSSASVTVSAGNNETKEILLTLAPNGDSAKKVLADDTDASHTVQERYASIKQAEYASRLAAAYPILKSLPITTHSLLIEACRSVASPSDPLKIALCVSSEDETAARQLVSPILAQKGYDTDTYEIIYKKAGAPAFTSDNAHLLIYPY